MGRDNLLEGILTGSLESLLIGFIFDLDKLDRRLRDLDKKSTISIEPVETIYYRNLPEGVPADVNEIMKISGVNFVVGKNDQGDLFINVRDK